VVHLRSCFLNLCEGHPGGPNATDWLIILGSVIGICAVIVAIAIPLTRMMVRRAKLRAPSMTMSFQVGNAERHTVAIAYYQPVRTLTVAVDGLSVISRSFTTGIKLTKTIEWTVGISERHVVQVEKSRQRVYGQFKPQQFVASVDGVVVARDSTLSGALRASGG